MKRIIVLISVILGSIGIDQLTKLLVLKFMELYESIPLIENVLHITYIQNRGAAFGMLAENRWVFMVLSSVAIVGIGVYLFRFCRERMLLQMGLALILGGGVGNMIDRIAYGYVVDMIDFCPFDFWVWIFNVADACVCVGAGIVLLSLALDIIGEIKQKKNDN